MKKGINKKNIVINVGIDNEKRSINEKNNPL